MKPITLAEFHRQNPVMYFIWAVWAVVILYAVLHA